MYLITEQDEGLEALSGIIQRQKIIGQAISDEVDLQDGQCNYLIICDVHKIRFSNKLHVGHHHVKKPPSANCTFYILRYFPMGRVSKRTRQICL